MPVSPDDPRLVEVVRNPNPDPKPYEAHPIFTEYRFVRINNIDVMAKWMVGGSLCSKCFTYNHSARNGPDDAYAKACRATSCSMGVFMPEADAVAYRLEVGE